VNAKNGSYTLKCDEQALNQKLSLFVMLLFFTPFPSFIYLPLSFFPSSHPFFFVVKWPPQIQLGFCGRTGVGSYGALGHCHAPSTSHNFILVYFGVNMTANYPNIVRVVCKISCQQFITALSIITASVTKLLLIEQLLHPALKFAVSAPRHNFKVCPNCHSSQ